MLLQHRRAFSNLVLGFDIAVVSISMLVGRKIATGETPEALTFLGLVALVAVVWTGLADRFGVYHSRRTSRWWSEWRDLCKTLILAYGVILVVQYTLVGALPIHMPWALGIAVAAMAGTRAVIRLLLSAARRRGHNTRTVLFIGRGKSGRAIAEDFLTNPRFGIVILGGLSFTGEETLPPIAGFDDLGGSGNLPDVVRANAVDEIVLCPSDGVWTTEVRSVLRFCETIGLSCRFAPDFLGLMPERTAVDNGAGVPTYLIQAGFQDSRWLGVKRLIDFAASTVALVVLAPLLGAIAAAIKLTSKGPVFFRQTRVGVNGRLFTMYKFRSMVVDAEQVREQLAAENEQEGPVFKMKHDPRITRVGRFLRKYSLDELPQLFNVLRGDMSIVGPRPPLPSEVLKYDWWQRRRLSVRPGLTCIWQVSGRNNISFDRWMEMDLQYIDGWSLKMDLQIMAKTVTEVLRGGGM